MTFFIAMFALLCAAGNYITWSTEYDEWSYVYRNGKNGWWTIFWFIIFLVAVTH